MKHFFKYFLRCAVTALLILCSGCVVCASALTQTEPAQKYDPATEGILSGYYHIDTEKGYIYGISPGTSSKKLKDVCTPATLSVADGNVGTGCSVSLSGGTSKNSTLLAVVMGDPDGDGAVTYSDLSMIETFLLNGSISEIAKQAADINLDGKVSVTDYIKLKEAIDSHNGSDDILFPRKMPKAPAILLMPNKTAAFDLSPLPEGTAGFYSDREELVSISPDGSITAHGIEGSAFVYAVDSEGNVLARRMVTVLDEPARVSFTKKRIVLTRGQSQKTEPIFNHPVFPEITWSSSDTACVTVKDATVLAVGTGKATVYASIDGGSAAQLEIEVVSPISSLSVERTQYKLKPGTAKKLNISVYPENASRVYSLSSSNSSVVAVSDDGTLSALSYGTATVTLTEKYSGLSVCCTVKVCDVKQVAMTFDDGPSNETARMLDFLLANEMKATFFMVGNRLGYVPNTVKRMAAEGHELGYHSYAHSHQPSMPSDQIKSDFERSNDHLMSLTGRSFTVWRTPGGNHDARVLDCIKLPHILWSVDTRDWELRNAEQIYKAIIAQAEDGDIILLHDLYGFSVDAAMKAMAELNAGDFEFVTVTELLSSDGTPPAPSKTYYHN